MAEATSISAGTTAPAPSAPSSPARPSKALYVLFFTTAGLVAGLISWQFLSASLAALGIPDPGPATTAGLPFLRAGGMMLAALAVGSFYFSSFLTPPRTQHVSEMYVDKRRLAAAEQRSQASGYGYEFHRESELATRLRVAELGVDGSLASRTGAVAALCFGMIAVAMVPMYLSDVSGEPLWQAMKPGNWSIAISQVSTSLAWIVVACVALVVGLGALLSKKWIMQPVWLLLSVLMIVPLGMEGHSASGGNHDYGTNSYLWHLLFMVLWVGGLMALIAHGRRRGTHLDIAVRRYSPLALVAVIGMTLSGLLNAAVRIDFSDWLTSGYGLLITAKAVGVVVLALFGFAHRRIAIPRLERDPNDHRTFRRIAIVEVLVMGAVTGVAVSLGRTPPPPPLVADINTMDIQLGYKLYEEPTIWNVWTMWRFDIAFATFGLILAGLYIYGLIKLRRKGESWPVRRSAWFLLGCATLVITMSSGIGMNIPATFSMHMVGHMILSMTIPVFWVLGYPLQLALKANEPSTSEVPGLYEFAEIALDNPVLRVVVHPVFNTVQFLVIFYLMYLVPSLYEVAISEHAGHLSMNVLFLWSGYMYYWDIMATDPLPVQRSPMSKTAWLTFSLPFHMYFAVYLMQTQQVMGEEFYSTLGLPWEVDLLWDQTVGGGIAWASGAFPLVIVYIVVLRKWLTADRRESRAYDTQADATDDEQLEAYNQWLQQVSRGEDRQDDYHNKDISRPRRR
ncbi:MULTISPECIES: cytochrome c oxidase assembly protein [Corynebacterium]|uniref:cytochrome c oxidase assembly protein n=1 Tax=Corynebacterium TaxID=1716 RepID=UPI001CEF8E2C|nr:MULTISPECIES: cytochrome c oxidase assembly protein [Corynebacterium]